MAVVQLEQFDIAVAHPYNFATGGFWASLPRICQRLPAAKILMISDKLRSSDVMRGFHKVAVSEKSLPPGVRAYRMQYEEFLGTQATQDVRYLRTYLVLDTSLGDEGLVRLLGTYGIAARIPQEPVPQPFTSGWSDWHMTIADDGTFWSMLRSKDQQYGSIYPRTLHRLFSLDFPVWAVLTVYTFPQAQAMQLLQRKSISAKHDKSEGEQAQEAGEVRSTVDRIIYETHRYGAALHTARLYVLIGADSKEELRTRKSVLSGALPLAMENAEATKMPDVFSAIPPTVSDGAALTSPGVSLLSGSILSFRRRTETHGVLLGMDRNQAPVILNIFDDRNPSYNSVVLGQTGSGKTFAMLTMMMRHLMLGTRSIIIDPQGNIDLPFLGSDAYHRSRLGTSEASINILDITRGELMDQVSSVKHTLRMLSVLPPADDLADSLLDDVLLDIYEPLWGKDIVSTQMPTLGAVEERLAYQVDSAQSARVRDCANALAFRLGPYTKGSLSNLFGRPTTVDFSLNAVVNVFDVSRLPDQTTGGNLRAALLAILVADINQSIRRRRQAGDQTPILFFVDEMGILMRDQVVAAYISAEYKTSRSRYVGMIVADQDLHSMLGPADPVSGLHHGIPILANAAFSLIFRQKGSEAGNIREHFPDVPRGLVDILPTMAQGTCVAQFPDDLLVVNVMASPLDRVILSSRLQDRLEARRVVERLMAEIGIVGDLRNEGEGR